jgi:hypothetical protein
VAEVRPFSENKREKSKSQVKKQNKEVLSFILFFFFIP